MLKTLFVMMFFSLLLGCSKPSKVSYISPICIEGQSVCKMNSKFGDFSILFNVKRPVAETQFEISLTFSQDPNITISSYIEGKDMYMGKIPLFFEKQQSTQYLANVLFGSCGREIMTWRLWLTLEDNAGDKQTHFIDFPSYLRP